MEAENEKLEELPSDCDNAEPSQSQIIRAETPRIPSVTPLQGATTEGRHRGARGLPRLLKEPTLHFLIIGALLFVVHRRAVGDQRTIIVSPIVKTELARRFHDQASRWPTPAELQKELRIWKTDEVLYREALRKRLDQEDPTVRAVMADKMRALAAIEVPKREPTDAELDQWLATHRELYETPLRYDFESVAFPKSDPASERHRASFEHALKAGANPAAMGYPIVSGSQTREQLQKRFGAELADRAPSFPLGDWRQLENAQSLMLVRINRIDGGLPTREVLRPRLVFDWGSATRQQAIDKAVQAVVARYRFAERP